VAIVTGGAQNIGAGIARNFSGAGAKVVIADLDAARAAETAHSISAETGGGSSVSVATSPTAMTSIV
jgi:7-alpha-hydroxysteroid dehydrogenase